MAAVSPLEIWRWHLSGWNDFFDRDKTITAKILAGRRRCLGWRNCAVLSLGRALPPRRNSGPSRRPSEGLKSAASGHPTARRLLRAQYAKPCGAAKLGAPYVAGF